MLKKTSVLEMNSGEARSFFLRSDSYFSTNFPPYFNFKKLLDIAEKLIGTGNLKDLKKIHTDKDGKYSKYSDINYSFQLNKSVDTYRPITLIHPYIYLDLVNYITKQENWEKIKLRFEELYQITSGKIKCSSIPFSVRQVNSEKVENKELALNYWRQIEQESIKLCLDYSYILKTDFNNFYGSIYTHSIAWAMDGERKTKDAIKKGHKASGLIGTQIDIRFQSMNYNETVGIPQGNVVSDLIAELLLAYIDSKLVKELDKEKYHNIDFQILRYRDDYRIFSTSTDDLTLIKKVLSQLLQRYKLSISTAKTIRSNDLIIDSLKHDKIYWIEHDPVIKITNDKFYNYPRKFLKTSLEKYKLKSISNQLFNRFLEHRMSNRIYTATLQKHLLIIDLFAEKFPNSGQLVGAIMEFISRIEDYQFKDFENSGTDIMVLLSITVHIIQSNPKITEVGVKLLSTLIRALPKKEKVEEVANWSEINTIISAYETKFSIISKINTRLALSSTNEFLQIWVQRLIATNLKSSSEFVRNYIKDSNNEMVSLVNCVANGKSADELKVFNQDWLEDEYRLDLSDLIDLNLVENLSDMITNEEISMAEYE